MHRLRQPLFGLAFFAFLIGLVNGKDYVITIGGGFAPEGNQASLEANVLFFQKIIQDKHHSEIEHKIYFADGLDAKEDLQVIAPKPVAASPAIELLNSVFDPSRDRITYRNHQVPDISGPLAPADVQKGVAEQIGRLKAGDRLIVYVTAHGIASTSKDKMDTAIACWNKKQIRMKQFAEWIDEVPNSIPVIMVMAQCYCGGFANSVFDEGEPSNGLSDLTRVGFFAQRHDLPAAGCRPDIENDEEYSSYFWGAFMGRLRSGSEIQDVDCNADNRVSFAEAHCFAVRESPTIDIPLRTSDEFLRRYSRIAGYSISPLGENSDGRDLSNDSELLGWQGTIEETAKQGSPALSRCALGLANAIGLDVNESLSQLSQLKKECEDQFRQNRPRPGRGGQRGPRGARVNRRREFRQELIAKWPELEDPKRWSELSWLQADQCEEFMEQVRELASYEPFQLSLKDRTESRERMTDSELKLVRYRRLIYTLETILLAKNFPKLATVEQSKKYAEILQVEDSFFDR